MLPSKLPPKPAHPGYPAMKWHPETGEATVYNSPHEVPEGHLDQHPASLEKTPALKPSAPSALPMTKAEIVTALKAGNIEYPATAGAKALYDLLDKTLREHLTANNVTIPDNANVPALLALVNPAS